MVDECGAIDAPTTNQPNGVVPYLDEKASALTISTANEWNPRGRYSEAAQISRTTASLHAPAVTQYGSPLVLTGAVQQTTIVAFADQAACRAEVRDPAWQSVRLEARDSSTGGWYLVGYLNDREFTANLVNRGAREYRVVRPDWFATEWIIYGATTATKLVRATTRVLSAKFIQPVIPYGTKPQAYLWVDPAGTQKAALQFKNASGAWQGVTYKTLYAGRGLVAFDWNRRGSTQFRWWVPGSTTTSTGLKVDPIYSSPFTLTVR